MQTPSMCLCFTSLNPSLLHYTANNERLGGYLGTSICIHLKWMKCRDSGGTPTINTVPGVKVQAPLGLLQHVSQFRLMGY